MRYHDTSTGTVKSKTMTTSISVPDAEQEEFWFTVGRNVKWCSTFVKLVGSFLQS